MKRLSIMLGSLLVLVALFVNSCGKEEKTATIQKFITIEDAILVSDDMPTTTTDETIEVSMNQQVIPGGSSYVSLISETIAKKILVGIEGQTGYYEITPVKARSNEYSFVFMVEQDIELPENNTGFTIKVAIVDENDGISEIWQTYVGLKVVGTGALQVSLSFDNAKDVDLHLIEPEYNDENGNPVPFYDRHIYFANSFATSGGELDLDSNAGCSIDNVNNENITYNENDAFVAPGTYKVYVDLYENCQPELATNYVVVVTYGGRQIASKSGIFPVNAPSTFDPITESYVESNEPFLTFTIGNNGQKCVKTYAPVEPSESAKEKLARSAQ